jgi:hypothetical protein
VGQWGDLDGSFPGFSADFGLKLALKLGGFVAVVSLPKGIDSVRVGVRGEPAEGLGAEREDEVPLPVGRQ